MVRLLQGTWLISPDDVWDFSQCPQSFLSAIDDARGLADRPPDITSELRSLMAEVLSEHRRRIRGSLETLATPVEIASPHTSELGPDRLLAALEESARATKHATLEKASVIFRPRFVEHDNRLPSMPVVFSGTVDVMTRSPALAPTVDQVDPGWELWEMKLGASQTGRALLRLAAMTYHLTQWGEQTTPRVRIVFANGPDTLRGIHSMVERWVELRTQLTDTLHTHLESGRVLAWPREDIPACGRKTCRWCAHVLRHHDDIFRLPGITAPERQALRQCGIATVTDFAHLSPSELTERAVGLPRESLTTLHTQATLLTLQKTQGGQPPFEVINRAALRALPAASEHDLFIDFEADPTFRSWSAEDPYFPTPARDHPRWWLGMDYLLGVSTVQTTPAGDYFTVLWAEDYDQERGNFLTLLDLIESAVDSDPTAHVYHYAPYEITALHRMANRYQVGKDTLRRFQARGVFVDLYRVVVKSLLAGIDNYSLKSVETLFTEPGGRTSISSGAESVLGFHRYLAQKASGDHALAESTRADLENYNLQDTLSTRSLAHWLRQL